MKQENQSKVVQWLARYYGWLNILIAYILLLVGFSLIIYTCADVVMEFRGGKGVMDITITFIHRLLIIMIILEILWTLKNYIRTKKLSVEAFIIIAIISSVRKILVISVSVSEVPIHHEGSVISPLIADVMIETFVIFLMVVAIYVLRKSRVLIKDLGEE